MPPGVQFAQLCHAAGESSPGNLPPDTHAVILGVDSEAQLLEVAARLSEAGCEFVLIREPNAPWLGAAMAVGVRPQPRTKKLRKLMSGLRLAGL